ncbi:hypothetical protein PINS_up010920 [Pythium insidiosum]|nr:hypothetical protein PINS_up010920 [Pythium insidiosum]
MSETVATPPPRTQAPGGDTGNAPSSSATTALSSLTTCVRTIVTTDLPYALCVLNSGLFGPSDGPQPPFLNGSTPEGLLFAQLQRLEPVRQNQVAVCKLHCASVRHHASTSCCDATRRLQACALSSPSPSRELLSCKATIDRSFLYSNHECAALSPQDTALVAISGGIFLVVAIFAFLWRRARLAPRQKHDLQSQPTKVSSSSASPTGILASIGDSVVQVANLLWKNTLLRRRRLGAFVMEQLLPLLFVSVLVLIANLDQFGTNPRGEDRMDTSAAGNQAFRLASPETQRLVCVGLAPTSPTALGAPPSTLRSFYASGQSVLGLFFVLSFVKFVSGTTAAMVYEKEIKMREVMKIMGVSDGVLVVSWCLTSSLLTLPLVLALSLLLKFGRVFPTTPVATVVFVFWSLQVAMAAFARAMTPWFNRARAASIVSVLVWLLLYFPYFVVQPKDASAKFPAALAPPTAFALAIDRLLREAQLGTGFAYSMTVSMQPTLFNGVPTATEMAWFLLLDSVLLLVIGWYLENVLPQSFGVRKPWYFIFQPSFWRVRRPHAFTSQRLGDSMETVDAYAVLGTPPAHRQADEERLTQSPIAVVDVDDDAGAPIIEPVSSELARQTSSSLQLHALTKVFPGRRSDGDAQPKRAVDALSLTLYNGQITALLGHNGAGKTTTISMLTGLIEPSSGDATMRGLSLRQDTDALRRLMGVCPQHDVLFPDLTVEEHLRFFATIKRQRLTAEDIDRTLDAVALRGARRVLSKSLSGGQKRKLSVALALLGNSPLVFLDEPTSGMDPYSRRFTWDLLRRERDNRVMVLTTHFMDEADVLGDRIAIVADGRLRCVGSSLFLKTRFGAGYKLTVIKSDEGASGGGENNDDDDVDPLLALVRAHVPNATRTGDSGSERVYQLPVGDDGGAATVAVFPALLDELDRRLDELKIRTYGLSVTTLEDVFLRIAGERDSESPSRSAAIGVAPSHSHPSTPGKHVSETAIMQPPTAWDQYVALLRKRLRIARRDRRSLVHALGVPLLFLVLLLWLPEIQVASFLPDYASSLPSPSQQAACPADRLAAAQLEFARDNTTDCADWHSYCGVGLIACEATACCNPADYRSPWYACANCPQGLSSCGNPVCMPPTAAKLQVSLNAFIIAMITTLALAFVPAALIAYIVREHEPTQDAKTLQCISGMNLASYWWANYTHDVALAVAAVAIAAVTLPFTSQTFASVEETAGVVLLVLVHGLAIVPMTYLYALKGGGRAGFTTYTRAQTSMLVFTLASGGLLSIFSFLCRVVDFSMGGGFTLSGLDRDYLRWVFLLFPGYALNNGLYEIGTRKLTRGALFGPERGGNPHSSFFGLARGFGKDLACPACWNRNVAGCCVRDVMDVDVVLAPILVQLVEAVLLMAVVLIVERRSQRRGQRSGSGSKLSSSEKKKKKSATPEFDSEAQNVKEDQDVANERLRLDAERLDESAQDAAIVLRHVHHRYGDGRVALHDLSLAIPRGECFGYLGVNGAGKSTTIKILTQQVAATRGDVVVAGRPLTAAGAGGMKNRLSSVVGYCPQFDALHDLLTVEEQLELYARIKGVPAAMIPREVSSVIDRLGLGEFRERLTRGLSGGNKRKVSTAIALLGNPAIVILDEPSTGMDPSARRKMWNVIAAQCAAKTTSVVLTTHSMEECEALCSRVGILVKGRLQCLGSVEHLRQTHGRGFTVDLKLETDANRAQLEELQTRVRLMLSTQMHGHHTDVMTLGNDEIAVVAAALGRPERAQVLDSSDGGDKIGNDISASVGGGGGRTRSLELLHQRFIGDDNTDGDDVAGGSRLPLELFCMWWQAQDRYDALEDFFSRRFEGSHVVEQHGDHFRFHIPKSHSVGAGGLGIRPREIFEAVEQQRARLRIQEYSVSDTSLEHIFNAMVAE